MEAKSFIKLLRKVIREEVQSVVRKEVRNALNEQKVNHKKVIEHGMDLHNVVESPRGPIAKKKKFVKDSMLNDILNETAIQSDFSTMRDGPAVYQTNDVNSFASNVSANTPLTETGINGEPVNMSNDNVAKTMEAMTRDYSGLIKAIDKKNGKMGTLK
tara:strand:- start:1239 stop:1712 length:474 start_codon:yes stop_codon:yes gene_type:complete